MAASGHVVKQAMEELLVRTNGRGLYEITREVEGCLSRHELSLGFAVLHIQHTSASLLIQENADPEVRADLERFFSRLCPDGDRLFRHTCEGPDDMPAHVRTALTSVNTTIPVKGGRLALGTWQGIYLWEHRALAHRRRVVVYLCGESSDEGF